MPRLDGTGPEGKGPMTGRGLGKCNPNNKTINKPLFKKAQRRDGTGPEGKGPGTGRGLGNCNTKNQNK